MKKRVFYYCDCDKRVTLSAGEFLECVLQCRKNGIGSLYAHCIYRYQRANGEYVYMFFIDEYNFLNNK